MRTRLPAQPDSIPQKPPGSLALCLAKAFFLCCCQSVTRTPSGTMLRKELPPVLPPRVDFPSCSVAHALLDRWNPAAGAFATGSDLARRILGVVVLAQTQVCTGSGSLISEQRLATVFSFRELQLRPNPSHLHAPLEPY